jgi:hypothetical protein
MGSLVGTLKMFKNVLVLNPKLFRYVHVIAKVLQLKLIYGPKDEGNVLDCLGRPSAFRRGRKARVKGHVMVEVEVMKGQTENETSADRCLKI